MARPSSCPRTCESVKARYVKRPRPISKSGQFLPYLRPFRLNGRVMGGASDGHHVHQAARGAGQALRDGLLLSPGERRRFPNYPSRDHFPSFLPAARHPRAFLARVLHLGGEAPPSMQSLHIRVLNRHPILVHVIPVGTLPGALHEQSRRSRVFHEPIHLHNLIASLRKTIPKKYPPPIDIEDLHRSRRRCWKTRLHWQARSPQSVLLTIARKKCSSSVSYIADAVLRIDTWVSFSAYV